MVILGPGQCPRPGRPERPGHPGRPGQIWAELSRFLARDSFFLSGTCSGQEFLLAHQPCVHSFQRKSIAFCQSGPAWWGRPGKRDVPGVRDNYPGRPGQLCAGVSRSAGSKPGFGGPVREYGPKCGSRMRISPRWSFHSEKFCFSLRNDHRA